MKKDIDWSCLLLVEVIVQKGKTWFKIYTKIMKKYAKESLINQEKMSDWIFFLEMLWLDGL